MQATVKMKQLLKELRHNPLLWLLAFVPMVPAAQKLKPEAHTLLFNLTALQEELMGRSDIVRGPAQRNPGTSVESLH